MTVATVVGLAFGLLLVALALPLMMRSIRPNRWYGLRVPSTLADEWVWYEANAMAGRDMVIVGVLVMIVAAVFPVIPGVAVRARVPITIALLAVGMTAVGIVSWRRADRLLDERRRRSA